jgi:hypothetical protein
MTKKSSRNIILSVLLLLAIIFSVVRIIYANSAIPNPGHDIATLGGYSATGDLLYGTNGVSGGVTGLSDVAVGNALLSNGAGSPPAWGDVNLTNTVTGVLPSANGGTNSAFFAISGPTAVRTYAFPDANAAIARTDASNIFVGLQTFGTVVATAGAGFQNMVVFTSGASQPWSLPAALQVTGAKWRVTIVGAGGQGGGSNTTAGMIGGGGGSGGAVVYYVTYVAGQNTMTYTVGAAGSGAGTNTTGNSGAVSSIIYNSVTITASGGTGGPTATAATTGGAGGAASGGTLNIVGNIGASSGTMAATSNFLGDGGNTPLGYGQGGRMPATAAGATGANGTGYGAGGSGGRTGTGATARAGGAGTGGLIVIEY